MVNGTPRVDGVDLPTDVWRVILAAAAAPLRQQPGGKDGRSHAARWLDLVLVCKQWHELMMQQPVGLRLDDDCCPPTSGRGIIGCSLYTYVSGCWTAAAALKQLAAGHVPVCSLHITVAETPTSPTGLSGYVPSATDGSTELSRAVSDMFMAAKFQAVSGPHLTAVSYEYYRGFELKVPPEAFPKLQRLTKVWARLESCPPRGLQALKIEGEWETIDYYYQASRCSFLGAQTDNSDVTDWLPSLRQLSTLSITGCTITKEMRAAMPPSLTTLRLRYCGVDAEDDGIPAHMCRTSYREHGDGLCSCRYELAPGTAAMA